MDYLHIPIDVTRNSTHPLTPTQDFSIPSIEQVDHFIKAVKEFRAKTAKAVGVHCLGGTGRTGLMLACWVVVDKNLDGAQAVAYVRSKYKPQACETEEQVRFVQHYYER